MTVSSQKDETQPWQYFVYACYCGFLLLLFSCEPQVVTHDPDTGYQIVEGNMKVRQVWAWFGFVQGLIAIGSLTLVYRSWTWTAVAASVFATLVVRDFARTGELILSQLIEVGSSQIVADDMCMTCGLWGSIPTVFAALAVRCIVGDPDKAFLLKIPIVVVALVVNGVGVIQFWVAIDHISGWFALPLLPILLVGLVLSKGSGYRQVRS